jgi:hypothetical protein
MNLHAATIVIGGHTRYIWITDIDSDPSMEAEILQ